MRDSSARITPYRLVAGAEEVADHPASLRAELGPRHVHLEQRHCRGRKTLEQRGHGLGIALAVVEEVAEELRGRVVPYEQPGLGLVRTHPDRVHRHVWPAVEHG